jgi:hypothetical protein
MTGGCDFVRKDWRRRPDLNRGWRFCRAIPGRFARSAALGIPPEVTRAQSDTVIDARCSSCVALAEI